MVDYTDKSEFNALIAEDDKIVSRMLSFALSQAGFACKSATDGIHATALMHHKQYDLVVTDLRMPNKNGHSLALEMLENESRPVIMIHTAVEDPSLTKDLIFRGVDDISFKPTNYEIFAAKARGLVERQYEKKIKIGDQNQGSSSRQKNEKNAFSSSVSNLTNGIRISPTKVYQRLSELETLLPISHTPFNVYSMASRENPDTTELAKLITRDAALTAEILKVANSAQSNSDGEEIDSIETAILLMGPHSIGERAVMYGARQALVECNIPWIDHDLLWKRCLAASYAVRVIERTQYADSDGSAFLCALLHPIGRIALATLFPDEHRELTLHCQESGESLDLAEEAAFGLSYGEVGARFFSSWRIPATSRQPLENITRTFDELIALQDQPRQRIEVVKLALLLSRVAMGLWEPCDSVDVPRKSVFNKLNMPSVQRTLFSIREACEFEIPTQQKQSEPGTDQSTQQATPIIEYLSAADTISDLLFPLLESMGLQVFDQRQELAHRDLIDGVSLGGNQLRQFVETQDSQDLYGIVRNKRDASLFKPDHSICLPTTIERLHSFFST
ncbi:HDOD domain-containing protein [uncultured Gimesia sp.]|uniref:HDOD domain-containing protein n=1 Tax=uncultured Gimesia sp. TaxID=1678688 RepID=UPI0030DB99E8|tara:strand:+ start:85879 stop:87564 length:1686 start_codon:yes stop_codon:yes gene_type:complete